MVILGNMGIMEKKMETTITGYIGFRASRLGSKDLPGPQKVCKMTPLWLL